jgi:hypothetical protein
MVAMLSGARFGVAAVWAITVTAAIGSVVLLAMSWHRALTDDLFSGFRGGVITAGTRTGVRPDPVSEPGLRSLSVG